MGSQLKLRPAIHGLLLALALMGSTVQAAVPHLVRYQGQAVDSQGVPLQGPYTLTFRLYDADTAGTIVWQEQQANVPLNKGHFSVLLGQVTALNVDWSQSLWLSIQVGTDPELLPRQRITSVPLAIRSEVAEGLVTQITTSTITDDANTLVPSGAVMFFDAATCPTGWTEMTNAKGRYLVGLPAGGTHGATVGTALANQENRPAGAHGHAVSDPGHTHTYPLSVPGLTSPSGWHFGVWAAQDANWTPQRDISREMTGITVQDYPGVSGTNAPYLQILICKKN